MIVRERNARSNLPRHLDPNKPIQLYDLFMTPRHQSLIAAHTNARAIKELQEQPETTQKRAWTATNQAEIGVFLGILLLMSLDHSPSIRSYWTIDPAKLVYPAVQHAMTLTRFEQIRRFLKINDIDDEPDSYGSEWWKKLEPLASDIQTASQEYYILGPHISIDEQLILFKGRSRNTLKMIAKVAGQGFKIYSLCEGNYLLAFLFTSKVSEVIQN